MKTIHWLIKNYTLAYKTIHWLIIGTLCLIASACGSDEPESPYGAWEIHYFEYYTGIHNNSPAFEKWFNNHKHCFIEAYFTNQSNNKIWHYNDEILLDDYKNYCGQIAWIEVVDNATESEIKKKVSEFESFTIIDESNNKSDRFQAEYQRYYGK